MNKKLVGRTALMEETQKPLYDIEAVCLSIEDRLRENLKLGRHYCDYIFHNGTEAVQKRAAAEVAQRMTEAGYYCQIGWVEIVPPRNGRWYIRVSVDAPKPTRWQRFIQALRAYLKMPKKSR